MKVSIYRVRFITPSYHLFEQPLLDLGELEHIKQQELNKLLANYLGSDDDDREQSPYESEFDDEDYNGFDERKRSMFRERGSK